MNGDLLCCASKRCSTEIPAHGTVSPDGLHRAGGSWSDAGGLRSSSQYLTTSGDTCGWFMSPSPLGNTWRMAW